VFGHPCGIEFLTKDLSQGLGAGKRSIQASELEGVNCDMTTVAVTYLSRPQNLWVRFFSDAFETLVFKRLNVIVVIKELSVNSTDKRLPIAL
jgi:hypothetical protein